jgi:hypothetical protein
MATPVPSPGPPIAADEDPSTWLAHCQGNADAIAFLAETSETILRDKVLVKRVLKPGLEREALPYLRLPDPLWRQQAGVRWGLGKPKGHGFRLPQLAALASQRGQQIVVLARGDLLSNGAAVVPELLVRWRWVDAQEGIWCGFYDDSPPVSPAS